MKNKWRKFFKILGGLLAVLCVALLAIILWSEYDKAVVKSYTKNENLPTIKSDWQGNPLDEKDRFVNEEIPFLPRALDIVKWQLSGNPQKEEKQTDAARLEVKDPTEFLQSEKDGILWLGHAGFFIRLNGMNISIDAVFGKPSLVKTFVDVPSPLDKIKNVDYILISHDHRDHCDETSVQQLTAKFPAAEILAGLRMDDILGEWKTPTNKLQTAGWYQQFSFKD